MLYQIKYFNLDLRNKEASSKIEETVERLKEKQKSETQTEPEDPVGGKKVENVNNVIPDQNNQKVAEISKKKSLWVRFKDEVLHYYSGFKLLFLDVQVSSKIVWKILRGKNLTRRESRQLVRTTSVRKTGASAKHELQL